MNTEADTIASGVFDEGSQMCDGSARAHPGLPDATTALLEQGRHLSLKGGKGYVSIQHKPQPSTLSALAMDCRLALSLQIEQLNLPVVDPTGNYPIVSLPETDPLAISCALQFQLPRNNPHIFIPAS
jgi:hypothetical protein